MIHNFSSRSCRSSRFNYSQPSPRKTGNAGQSPFVLVFNRAGVKGQYLFKVTHSFSERFIFSVLPHILNAIVLTSAFSSANGMLYSVSRLLFALGVQGHAPNVITTLSHNGVPYVAIITAVRQT
jgi:yeast amino acid transporter